MAVKLDEVDIQLLDALQENADRTNVELARLVGLSPAATLHRVRYLKESGVIRIITARLDHGADGVPGPALATRGSAGDRTVASPRTAAGR